jgi:hypothetical protein
MGANPEFIVASKLYCTVAEAGTAVRAIPKAATALITKQLEP